MAWYNGFPDLNDEEVLATWKEEVPHERPDYGVENKITARARTMKAKMRAFLWGVSYTIEVSQNCRSHAYSEFQEALQRPPHARFDFAAG